MSQNKTSNEVSNLLKQSFCFVGFLEKLSDISKMMHFTSWSWPCCSRPCSALVLYVIVALLTPLAQISIRRSSNNVQHHQRLHTFDDRTDDDDDGDAEQQYIDLQGGAQTRWNIPTLHRSSNWAVSKRLATIIAMKVVMNTINIVMPIIITRDSRNCYSAS